MILTLILKIAKKYLRFKKQPNDYKERQNEIIELNQKLEEFGIPYSNLIEQSPKCPIAAKTLFGISKSLAENEELLHILFIKGNLPIHELVISNVGISSKTLEEHHHFIIAMTLILSGPYPCLRKYISCSIR